MSAILRDDIHHRRLTLILYVSDGLLNNTAQRSGFGDGAESARFISLG